MAVTFLPADTEIIKGIKIIISGNPPPIGTDISSGGSAAGPATALLNSLGHGVLPFSRDSFDNPINLQFPVKVTSDGKAANWHVKDVATYEPVAIFKGAAARFLGLELTYINTGGEWNGERISEIERMIKSYFYRTMQSANEGNAPVVVIQNLYGKVLRRRSTWRMKDVAVDHGDGTLISAGGGNAFPLLSKITMNLESYTQIAGFAAEGGDGKEVKQIQDNLEESPKSHWY